MTAKSIELTRKEYDFIAEKRGIQDPQDMSTEKLLNTLSRYDSKRKAKSIRIKLQRLGLEKIQNISKNDFNRAKKLQEKSIDELKAIVRLRRFKNFKKLTKEDLIFTLLNSESSALENNFSNTNDDDDDDENYDNKIRGKIIYIRIVLRRLGNMITNKKRKII